MFSLSEALLIMLISCPFYLCGRGIYFRKKKLHFNFLREFLMLLLYLCIIFILTMTVIPKIEIAPDNSFSILRTYSHSNRINVVPLSFINEVKDYCQNGLYYSVLFNLAGNIIPFAAVSAACALLWDYFKNIKHILIFGIISSLLIEIIQIPLYRGTDIDDIILNLFGYIFGFLVFLLLNNFLPKFTAMFNKKERTK